MAEMNVTGFSDDYTLFLNLFNVSKQEIDSLRFDAEQWEQWERYETTTMAIRRIIEYVIIALGIPGNILSAIVWVRRHIASESPPAIYLAALAINDLVFLICLGAIYSTLTYKKDEVLGVMYRESNALHLCLEYVLTFNAVLEPLLVLSFSAVRLIAIHRPLQV